MNIIISPIFQQFFSGRIWMGLEVEKIKKTLTEEYNLQTKIVPFKCIVSQLDTIEKGSLLFYSSTYNKEYLKYIKDTIHYISIVRPDIVLLPNQDQLRALENKGYQEYYKMQLGIERVVGKYYGDINDLIEDQTKMSFPFVLKLNEGALSSGVQLIQSAEELLKFQARIKKRTLKEKAAYLLNKKNSFNKDNNLNPHEGLLEKNFEDFFQKRKPVVTQEFIPGLECDYKVLIFGEKYFVFKRETRKNDFRASGSGKFSWVEPPKEVLSYAKLISKKMDVAFISLDIGIDKLKECYLFEFQGTAFGPIGITQSDKYYIFQKGEWIKIVTSSNLEKTYAYAVNYFINKLHENN